MLWVSWKQSFAAETEEIKSFFKKLQIVENKSWLSDDETYLLFDYVHLLKTHSELVANGENTATSV